MPPIARNIYWKTKTRGGGDLVSTQAAKLNRPRDRINSTASTPIQQAKQQSGL